MSDKDLPDLPSDEELGITEEDIQAWEREQSGDAKPATEPAPRPPAGAPGRPAKAPPTPGDGPPTPGDGPPAPAATPPPRGRRGLITLAVLLLAGVLSASWTSIPSPEPATAPDSTFSSARAMSHLLEIARAAHPPGSPEHTRVRAYLIDALESMGVEATVQTATSGVRQGPFLQTATVRNIVARIPGSAPTGTVVLTAHYDGRELSPAAGDDGVGVVTVLETVRALLTDGPPRNDVLVLLTDGEELGLLGARAFVEQDPRMADVSVVISVEMRGGGGPALMFETGAEAGWIIDRYRESAPSPVATSLAQEIYARMPNDSDFTPFREAGVQGLNFAGIGRAHLYHQSYDTPENVSEATIQHHGVQVSAVTRDLAAADLGTVTGPDPAYFTLPFLGLVVYPAAWAVPLAVALLVLTFGLLLLTRRRGGTTTGLLVGAGLGVVAASLAYGIGMWAWAWTGAFHPEQGALHGSAFHVEGWYVLALAAACLAVVTALYGVARRRFGLGALATGALLLPLVAAVAAAGIAPRGAHHFQWPTLAGILAAAMVTGVAARRMPGRAAWTVALLLAVPVVAMWVPLMELLWTAMNFSMAPWIGVLVTLALLSLLPALDAFMVPRAWPAPVLAIVAAAGLLGVGMLQAEPSADRPAPSTLAYAVDRGSGQALWIAGPYEDDAPAMVWAADRAGADFGETRSLAFLGVGGRGRPTAPADLVPVAAPRISVAAVSSGPVLAPLDLPTDPSDPSASAMPPMGPRMVRVALRSEVGAELLAVLLDGAGANVPRVVAVNGRPVEDMTLLAGAPENPIAVVQHWGTPVGYLYLDFEVAPGVDTLAFALVETLFRPQELVGEARFTRPPELAPDVRYGSDRALIRTPVRLAIQAGAVNAAVEGPAAGDLGPEASGATADSLPTLIPDSAAAAMDTLAVPPLDSLTVPPPQGRPTLRDTVLDTLDGVPSAAAAADTVGRRR